MAPDVLVRGALDGTEIVTESTAARDDESDSAKAVRTRAEEVLRIARQRFKAACDAEEHYRRNAVLDGKFRAGTWGDQTYQWPDGVQAERVSQQRPCLTINRAPGFIRQVTNAARQANLRIVVKPVDDQGDVKLAQVFQGIIRNIESNSFADRAYAMASEKQAENGRGVIRLLTEYADEDSFRQRIRIVREPNPLCWYWDPAAREPDYRDAEWCFKVEDLDAKVFEDRTGYPPPNKSGLEAFSHDGDQTGEWFPNDKVRIAEYFSREPYGAVKYMAQLSSGDVMEVPEDERDETRWRAQLKAAGISVLRVRRVQRRAIFWRKIDALRIHAETIWPADAMPGIPVLGEELEVEGIRDYRGVVRDFKEPARVYNVMVTGVVEQVGLGQKAPVVGYSGQFGAPNSGTRRAWEIANQKPVAFLEVEPLTIDGKPAPFPQRNTFEPPLEGTLLALHQADEDCKTTAGFRDASLGERGPQESGRAIIARQRQDELGSSHYLDNLRFALASAGRQLIQLIRVVYDEPTVIRIVGPDERQKAVMVFAGAQNDPRLQGGYRPKNNVELYDLSVGEFDVEVNAGPNPGSRREQELTQMVEIFKTLPPEVSSKFLDIQFALFDTAIGRQMSERAKKLLPEGLANEDGDTPSPEALQAKLAQLQDVFGKLQKAYEVAKQELATEKQKLAAQVQMHEIDAQAREHVAMIAAQTKLADTQVKVDASKAETQIEALEHRFTELLGMVHEMRMAQHERAHELRVMGHEHGHALHLGEQARQQEREAGDVEHRQALEQTAAEYQQAAAAAGADRAHEAGMGAAEHGARLREGALGHRQALEAGDVAHRQTLEQNEQAAALAPKPKPTE